MVLSNFAKLDRLSFDICEQGKGPKIGPEKASQSQMMVDFKLST
jgi:hypothetical protein